MAAPQPPDRDDFAAEPRSIDLRDYWLVVRRRWVLILVIAVLGAAAGLGYALYRGPTYSATAQVLVAPVTQGPLNVPAQVDVLVNMSSEQAVAESAPVIRQAAELMQTPLVVLETQASNRLTVAVPITSDVLQITWQAGTARAAQQGANAFARAYLSYRHSLLAGQIGGLESILGKQADTLRHKITHVSAEMGRLPAGPGRESLVTTLSQLNDQLSTANGALAALPTYDDTGGHVIAASPPIKPSGLRPAVILVLGGILGLLAGLALAFTRDAFDDRVRDAAQLERKLGVATLGVLLPARNRRAAPGKGRDAGQHAPPIVTIANPDSRGADAVRALRTTLIAAAVRRNLRTILVAGADASVSSGLIAAELGVALAESGRQVLLVAADLRGSSLPPIFDVPSAAGLSDVLVGGGYPEALTRQPRHVAGVTLPSAIYKRLAVLPSGSHSTHALSALDSGAMVGLLKSQREAYEYVVLDSPAVAADIYALAAHVDGVIVIARQARTRGRAVDELRRGLDQVDALLIGGVLIGRGRGRADRRRPPGTAAQPVASASVASASVASAERRGRPQPADRRPQPVTRTQPDGHATTPPDPASLARRPLEQPARPPRPAGLERRSQVDVDDGSDP